MTPGSFCLYIPLYVIFVDLARKNGLSFSSETKTYGLGHSYPGGLAFKSWLQN